MDSSTPTLLKQEINQTQEAEHDLAKWKLIVTASLGAAAFGLTSSNKLNYWLLFFIPFVCAYVDLCDYQYRLRVLVIARFLRENSSDREMQEYERECERVRQSCSQDFDLGRWAGIGSSVVASVLGPLLYFLAAPPLASDPAHPAVWIHPYAAYPIWIAGVLLVFWLYWDFREKEKKLSSGSTSTQPS